MSDVDSALRQRAASVSGDVSAGSSLRRRRLSSTRRKSADGAHTMLRGMAAPNGGGNGVHHQRGGDGGADEVVAEATVKRLIELMASLDTKVARVVYYLVTT